MKAVQEFLKNMLVIYGAAVICLYAAFVFITPLERVRYTMPLELFCAIFMVTLLRVFTDKLDFKYAILERLLDWALITLVIVANWWFFSWYVRVSIIFIFLSTIVIYLLVWFTLRNMTRRDIASINDKIRQRKARKNRDTKTTNF